MPKKEIPETEEIEALQRGLEINEKIVEFDLIKIEEADIDFDKGQLKNDYLVNIQSVPNNVVLLD